VTEGRYPGDALDATQADADECVAAADSVEWVDAFALVRGLTDTQ
jgi:hypothetical protein